MPRVLLLLEYPSLNGGERSLLTMLPAIRAHGWDVFAGAPGEGPLAQTLDDLGVPHLEIEPGPTTSGRRTQASRRHRVAELCRQAAPDLVHANSLSMARLSGPVLRELGICSLGHLRDILKLSGAAIADLNCHDRLLAVSAATRDYHVAAGLDAARVQVLYNGVDLARFAPRPPTGAWHARLGIPPQAPLLGSIGQVGMRKGLDVTMRAMRIVMRDEPTAHWLIVGERHSEKDEAHRYEEELRAAAAQPPLKGRVHFVGRLPDAAELLNELTLLIHTAHQEPLGRVLLEAAAAGVPVIATDVGGTREIYPPAANAATLLPANNPVAVTLAVERLLADASLREQHAAAARRIAEENFAAGPAGQNLAAHYQAVWQGRK